jgi:cyclophilin family peptidyl-prolyl cis-trans isomerase
MFKSFATAALPFAALILAAAAPAPVPGVMAPIPGLVPPPEVVADPANKWTIELSNGGTVVILLRPDLAPAHVARVRALTKEHFYDGLTFHRVIPGFMAQGGDPTGSGEGGSKLPDLKAEFNQVPFMRGSVGAARTGEPDTANSQFFITFVPYGTLDGNYTNFGRVISGMGAVDTIAPGEPPAEPTKIVKATIGG